jgi:hypothetical protein
MLYNRCVHVDLNQSLNWNLRSFEREITFISAQCTANRVFNHLDPPFVALDVKGAAGTHRLPFLPSETHCMNALLYFSPPFEGHCVNPSFLASSQGGMDQQKLQEMLAGLQAQGGAGGAMGGLGDVSQQMRSPCCISPRGLRIRFQYLLRACLFLGSYKAANLLVQDVLVLAG